MIDQHSHEVKTLRLYHERQVSAGRLRCQTSLVTFSFLNAHWQVAIPLRQQVIVNSSLYFLRVLTSCVNTNEGTS